MVEDFGKRALSGMVQHVIKYVKSNTVPATLDLAPAGAIIMNQRVRSAFHLSGTKHVIKYVKSNTVPATLDLAPAGAIIMNQRVRSAFHLSGTNGS